MDLRHTRVTDRVFDKLSFPLLVAGELETASSEEISQEERSARVNIAKTICYHKAYLSDQDLQDGYDQLIKSVEQGKRDWSSNLGEQLHDFYDYQANKLLREKVQTDQLPTERFNKSTAKTDRTTAVDTTVYCGAYNKGRCTYDDHHEGKFNGKTVTKWHICSKCYKIGEKRSHRDSECYIKS